MFLTYLTGNTETTKTHCNVGLPEPKSPRAAKEAISCLIPFPRHCWDCRPAALPAPALAAPVAGEACGGGERWRPRPGGSENTAPRCRRRERQQLPRPSRRQQAAGEGNPALPRPAGLSRCRYGPCETRQRALPVAKGRRPRRRAAAGTRRGGQGCCCLKVIPVGPGGSGWGQREPRTATPVSTARGTRPGPWSLGLRGTGSAGPGRRRGRFGDLRGGRAGWAAAAPPCETGAWGERIRGGPENTTCAVSDSVRDGPGQV